ncbi:MAG: hypothetical protein M1449_00025 [Candidatus Thermoplasmatota archaeon]|nr:hypothetical protein [Candidatus Thermoplasmatota archaeon]
MNDNILERNRVILCHFDSYSAALLFARYGDSVLAPAPLPESASDMPAPGDIGEQHAPGAVLDALIAKYALDPAQLKIDDGFQAWLSDDSGPNRIHLARFTTFEAPREAIEPLGGVFKPISQMRGMPMTELNLMRQVFNLIMGGR